MTHIIAIIPPGPSAYLTLDSDLRVGSGPTLGATKEVTPTWLLPMPDRYSGAALQ